MKHETLSPTLSTLLKARMLIEANWGKGPSVGNQVCAMEALWKVNPFAGGVTPFGKGVECLQKVLPGSWIAVMDYNDHPSTTKADILALYDRAIDLALKNEQ